MYSVLYDVANIDPRWLAVNSYLRVGWLETTEPRPLARGNVARAIFYMSKEYGLPDDAELGRLLLRWHRADPFRQAIYLGPFFLAIIFKAALIFSSSAWMVKGFTI